MVLKEWKKYSFYLGGCESLGRTVEIKQWVNKQKSVITLGWPIWQECVNCVGTQDDNVTMLDWFLGHQSKLGHFDLDEKQLN